MKLKLLVLAVLALTNTLRGTPAITPISSSVQQIQFPGEPLQYVILMTFGISATTTESLWLNPANFLSYGLRDLAGQTVNEGSGGISQITGNVSFQNGQMVLPAGNTAEVSISWTLLPPPSTVQLGVDTVKYSPSPDMLTSTVVPLGNTIVSPTVQAIPEQGTVGLLATASLPMLVRRKRRNR